MNVKVAVKLAVSIGMLLLILSRVDTAKLGSVWQSVPGWLLVTICAGYIGTQLVGSVRWRILLRAAGMNVSYRRAASAHFIGMYLNCFGLGTLGGDVAKALIIGKGGGASSGSALVTVVADRALGLATLAFIAVSSAIVFHSWNGQSSLLALALAITLFVPVAFAIGPKALMYLSRRSAKWTAKSQVVFDAIPRSLPVLTRFSIVAFTFHLSQIALFALLAYGMSVPIPWSYLLVAIPFANIATTLPISWMGLGLRENVYVFFFVPAYLMEEQAVVFGAIWFLAITIGSGVGGILAVASADLKSIRKPSSANGDAPLTADAPGPLGLSPVTRGTEAPPS